MQNKNDFKEIFKYKYLVNAEYLKTILNEKNIETIIDYDNNFILVRESNFGAAQTIIQNEKLDETETIDQENFMEGFEEWNKERLNPGHYLGGNLPYYYRTKSNHMTFAVMFFISSLFQIGLLFFSNITLWNIIFIIITIAISLNFMISGFDYRDGLREKKNKKNSKTNRGNN